MIQGVVSRNFKSQGGGSDPLGPPQGHLWSRGLVQGCESLDAQFEPCCCPNIFLSFFCQFLITEGSQGCHRFENTPKMGFFRHPAAAMIPPFLNSALKVIYGHDSGNQRKPAEHAQKLTYLKVSYGNQGSKCLKFEFFKIGPFKIKNKAIGVYPYPTRAPHATPIPTSLKVHLYSFLTRLSYLACF